MDPLDTILFDAWHNLSAKLRHDRVRAARRSRRRLGILTRPLRPWCLVIRASDTRINPMRAYIDPKDALEYHVPHTVTLDGKLIRRLTQPVQIPWPGVTYAKAAEMLGRDYQTLAYWGYKGALHVTRYWRLRRPFQREPVVWLDSPIDPNYPRGRVPHRIFGSLWQWMWQKLPENYVIDVQRVPRFRDHPGKGRRGLGGGDTQFRGWYFICPGRLAYPSPTSGGGRGVSAAGLDSSPSLQRQRRFSPSLEGGGAGVGESPEIDAEPNLHCNDDEPSLAHRDGLVHIPCGRRCNYLYGPQSVWTLPQALDDPTRIQLPPEVASEGLRIVRGPEREIWDAGMSDPIKATGPRSFACRRCWRVRNLSWASSTGWNEFISHISGGLLYGREVPRPPEICPIERKRPYKPRPGNNAKRYATKKKIEPAKARKVG